MQVLNASTVVQLSSSCFTECITMPEYHVCIYVYTVRVIKNVTLNGNRNAHNS